MAQGLQLERAIWWSTQDTGHNHEAGNALLVFAPKSKGLSAPASTRNPVRALVLAQRHANGLMIGMIQILWKVLRG